MRLHHASGISLARSLAFCSITLLLFLTGCITAKSDAAQITAPTAAPAIKLLTPWAGQTLPVTEVEVLVEISEFIVDRESIGESTVAGRGHWHFYLDGEFMQASAKDFIVLDPLPTGPHHMRVALANNDHSPLNPPVEDSVVVDVVGGEEIATLDMDPEY